MGEKADVSEWMRNLSYSMAEQFLVDTKQLLRKAGFPRLTTNQVIALAIPLFKKRTPHILRVQEATLKVLIAEERGKEVT